MVANTPAYLDLNTAKLEVTVVVEDSAEEKVVEEREGVVRVVVDSAAEEAKETAEEAMDSEEEAMDSEEAEKATVEVDSAAEEAMDSVEAGMDLEEAGKATGVARYLLRAAMFPGRAGAYQAVFAILADHFSY